MAQTSFFPVVNDSALAALILKTQGALPKASGLVVSNANGSQAEGVIVMARGSATFTVNGVGTYTFSLEQGWPTSHDHLLAWVESATNFHAIKVFGSFAASRTTGSIVMTSEDPTPLAPAAGSPIVPGAISQTITVGYLSFGT